MSSALSKFRLYDQEELTKQLPSLLSNLLEGRLESGKSLPSQEVIDRYITTILSKCICVFDPRIIDKDTSKSECAKIVDRYNKGAEFRPLKYSARHSDVRYKGLTDEQYYTYFFKPLIMCRAANLSNLNSWDAALYKSLGNRKYDFFDSW